MGAAERMEGCDPAVEEPEQKTGGREREVQS